MQEIPRSDFSALVKLVTSNTLLNKQLSSICQLNGLTSSGVKAHLQNRIVSLITETVNNQDLARFRQIESSIRATRDARANGSGNARPSPAKPVYDPHSIMPAQQPRNNFYNHHYSGGSLTNGANGFRGSSQISLSFKPSPFYEIRCPIGSVRICEAMNQHRNMVPMSIRVNDFPIIGQCIEDKTMRIMLFCAGDKHGIQDIAFPHQSEVKVNGGEVKANLRGLKNRPGSTRPVDITDQLRLKPGNYENRVELVYALTQKPFYVGIYLCQATTVEGLVAKIQVGKKIPKASVIQEITKKAADTDIVTTSQVLSLKCPLSYMRLALPCRSVNCTHIQCFDATSYLQLQEQGPQWLCPICNKSAPFDALAVDEYVKDILANTSTELEQVTIETDAQWRAQSSVEDQPPTRSANSAFDDDDDDLVISEVSFTGVRPVETPSRSLHSTATPTATAASRDGSSLPRGLGSVSGKRPAPQHDVVDLTLSSDDEDGPPPAKKQQLTPHPTLPDTRFY